MSATKKNEAMRLLFTFVLSFLMCCLVSWILRLFGSRPSTPHPILTNGLAGALAATIVVMWNNRAWKKPKMLD
jgi:hypothetical protein